MRGPAEEYNPDEMSLALTYKCAGGCDFCVFETGLHHTDKMDIHVIEK